jgi:hypothetical protein
MNTHGKPSSLGDVDENYNFTSNGTDQRKESGATFFGEKKERPMESVGEVKRKYKRGSATKM